MGATALVALGVLNPAAMQPTVATRMQVGVYPVPKKLAVYTATSRAYLDGQNETTFATGFSVFF